jgi:hypothetical protein
MPDALVLRCYRVNHSIQQEVNMTPEASQEYQRAVEEAANAFMKVMALRGFNVRDYPQNFVASMAQQTRLAFETSRQGAHQQADHLVSELLRTAPNTPQHMPSVKTTPMTFPALRRRMA